MLRERLRSWLLYLMATSGQNQTDFAASVGVAQPTVNGIISRKRGVGVDVLRKMSRWSHKSMDVMVEVDPPEVAESPPGPRRASGVGAESRGQNKARNGAN
jgi:hypothetical protein